MAIRPSLILVVAAACSIAACRNTPSFSHRSVRAGAGRSQIPIAGLSAPVRIVRDRWGVPHIYGSSRDDAFVAQGFVQAQDRLFQMDLWRRSVQGRLSEVLGPNFIERDAMTRRVHYEIGGNPAAAWAREGADARDTAAAFVRGVNAYVDLALDNPPEEFVLAGWLPAFWVAEDLLNRADEFPKAAALADAARQQLPDVVADAIRRIATPPFFVSLAAAPAVPLKIDAAPNRDRELLSTDAHIPHPSLEYLVHLQAPGLNVIGATQPWRPGVADGHDDFAVVSPARSEVAQARDPKDRPSSVPWVREEPATATVRTIKDFIVVKGRRRPFEFESELTADGVVIASNKARNVNYVLAWPTVVQQVPSPGPRRRAPNRALFAHVLAISDTTRRRFNIGPMPRPPDDRPFRAEFNSEAWDDSRVILAPGQSEWADSRHFSDLATLWSSGQTFPLVFSDAAVNANAESTLMLVPLSPKANR